MQAYGVLLFGFVLLFACDGNPEVAEHEVAVALVEREEFSYSDSIALRFATHPAYVADGFDFPVGKPDAKQYYNAQPFGVNFHLGDDWNGTGGGNTDLGDPIYAVANGVVNYAENVGGGWGNIIRLWHQLPDSSLVESFYAHCDTILVNSGSFVRKGQQVGTIGTCDGAYLAHLHFEMRKDVNLPIGPGYSSDTLGYLNPTSFILANRK